MSGLDQRGAGLRVLVRRHAAMVALSVVLLGMGGLSLGCFLKSTGFQSDDYRWVFSTVRNAGQPWRVFDPRARLFGSYYRPMAHLVWILNYAVWGFEFRGHQLTLIAMWLGSVWFVYGIGVRLHGRLAGLLGAACFGLNLVYLQIVSWKAWFTTLTELLFVLACVWAFVTALQRRSRAWFVAAGVLGVLAVLSRELAPLVLSAVVFAALVEPPIRSGRWTWRRAGWVLAWAAGSLAVLMVLPSYRQAAGALLLRPFGAGPQGVAPGAFSMQHAETNLAVHLESLYRTGFFPPVMLFVVLAEYVRMRNMQRSLGGRRHSILLGAAVLLVALPWALYLAYSGLSQMARAVSGNPTASDVRSPRLAMLAGLTLLFVWVATRGRKFPRMLGAWFVVAFVPVLLLQHHSNAYHLLALVPMCLFAGSVLAREVQDELLPAIEVVRGRAHAPREWGAMAAHAVMVACALGGVGWMLGRNMVAAAPVIRGRARQGRQDRAAVARAVRSARADFRTGTVCAMPEDRARLAGLILRERHGFSYREIASRDGAVVPYRSVNLALGVFERAAPLVSHRSANLIRNGGFEEPDAGQPVVGPGYLSRCALLVEVSAGQDAGGRQVDFTLPPVSRGVWAFGAVSRADANVGRVEVALIVHTRSGDRVFDGYVRDLGGGWRQAAGCASLPPDATRVTLRIAVVRRRGAARAQAVVDEVFVIPFPTPRSSARAKGAVGRPVYRLKSE